MDPRQATESEASILAIESFNQQFKTEPTQAASSPASVSAIDTFNQQFTVDVPDEIDVDLGGSATTGDVLNARSQAEAEITPAPDVLGEVSQTVDTPVTASRFDDYNQIIEDQLFGEDEPTEAEKSRQQILDDYASRVEKIESNINLTESDAREQYQLAERERELAETDLRIAEKTTALRRRLRRFDADPERAALSRRAFEQERAKIESDARAELADEYIIQAAQSGNLQRAEQLVQTAVENRIRSFELRNQADQARLNALIPTLEGEEKKRAQQLAFALQERERNIADVKAEQEGIHNMMITAATNGASGDIQRQILGAKTLDEAMALAGPFIGRYERLQVESSLATAALNRKAKLVEMALAGDKAAAAQLGQFGKDLLAKQAEQKTLEEQELFETNINAGIKLESRIKRYSAQLGNDAGWGLATGEFQSPYIAGAAQQIGAGVAVGTGVGAAVGGVGAIPGAVLGFGAGVASAPFRGAKLANQRNDLLNTATEIINIGGFDNLIDYKAAGATFGALSDSEFNAIKAASGPLAAAANMQDGRVVGFLGSEEQARAAYQEAIKVLDEQLQELNEDIVPQKDQFEVISITGGR